MSWDRREPKEYKLKVIKGKGFACVSVEGRNFYNDQGRPEPKGKLYYYKDKPKKSFVILKKLGLWTNGRILPLIKRPW